MFTSIKNIVQQFSLISLEEMDRVKLMDRTDTKFIIHSKLIPEILESIRPNYKLLSVNNNLIGAYTTRYFDTPDHQLYIDHQNGKCNRIKVRQRDYLNDNISFLEIKNKTNTGRTIKKRIVIETDELTEQKQKEYLLKRTGIDASDLTLALTNKFNRITLVHNTLPERATIDFGISYHANDKTQSPDFLGIVEIKQSKSTTKSELYKTLQFNYRVKENSISKYCLGMMMLDNEIKKNRFKEKLLILKKLEQHGTI